MASPSSTPGLLRISWHSHQRRRERELIEGYLEMRRLGGNAKTITATPRQLESLIRLSEALARMKWAPVVERSDVVEAIRLMKVLGNTYLMNGTTDL